LIPGTGHDILNDIQDVFKFIMENNVTHRKTTFEIDPEKIIVAGGSSGGTLAYLAAAHITSPKPKGVLAIYAMGGDFFVSFNNGYPNFFHYNSQFKDTALAAAKDQAFLHGATPCRSNQF
jgi:acetyl esterase/lipase